MNFSISITKFIDLRIKNFVKLIYITCQTLTLLLNNPQFLFLRFSENCSCKNGSCKENHSETILKILSSQMGYTRYLKFLYLLKMLLKMLDSENTCHQKGVKLKIYIFHYFNSNYVSCITLY